MPRRVVAIVAAAGKGKRLGAELPKAYVPLRGKALLVRSVQAMLTSGIVDEVIVIISPEMQDYAERILGQAGLLPSPEIPVRLVHGGEERADSVWCGLQSLPDKDAVVLIHDSARALTPPGMIARVARAVLEGAEAVIPVLPVADTIKEVDGTTVLRTPVRSSLRAVQTPQGFDLAQLRAANLAYFEQQPEFIATDDASLMEWFGVNVQCVQGDPMAFKVTTPLDYALAKAVTDEAEPTIFEVPSD
ncbi:MULTISPECIES: 2-C-methyl-D-erythritol 4-phosphate cytidylyltransferase [Corynebacterium]|uniref:2-C-methyl-D-erythritol 4-phosphate cytidylyltransferase n=3 Tax=Corynebacterium TaxID=1716 RepID=A0ABD7MVT7_CORUL|nr:MULTISPECIES: 2-C-methyl-D-erythritol 4-phosphate cytidylyltransferase [Corynebacterium]AEG82360.1 4-diphosphocytidyl-2C-methyl-D-erythritolsynthase [Corynebacterium ulcerans 809]AEG84693.1 4-diphosphocytidyl-2C-methyl-D-erythritolsynthase [Corynebacterium ulcerans BR-AD22]AIU31219.1 2-C-methyl-D-erythritol 4-phosphate cytidylyltransferase [Corynebacterium ulcerans]AIU33399.1 2-C-methyl-D-erythritol 4-phosphate cytidylyltransferase [Corynebacterium ramonii FRC0011]AIU92489.1 2-C-methyl-D-er